MQSQIPLVVFAGWMGSQNKQLRHYEELYKQAGFQKLSFVATPTMVLGAALSRQVTEVQMPPEWPESSQSVSSASIQDLAWHILAKVHSINPPLVLFHVFSNGGCFLWEQIRLILGSEKRRSRQVDSVAVKNIAEVRSKVGGVVFDSCPGAELHRITEALEYCTLDERTEAFRYHGISSPSYFEKQSVKKQLRERSISYLNRLRTDDWARPQLYLYSGDDSLALPDAIDELVEFRRDLIGPDLIRSHRWEHSSHVTHLRLHRDEYTAAVASFISLCKSIQNRRHARL